MVIQSTHRIFEENIMHWNPTETISPDVLVRRNDHSPGGRRDRTFAGMRPPGSPWIEEKFQSINHSTHDSING
jgi:hypothetical protein